MNFLFTLVGVLEMSLPETLLIGLASTLAQSYWRAARRLKLVQLVFNLSQVTICSAAAYGALNCASTVPAGLRFCSMSSATRSQPPLKTPSRIRFTSSVCRPCFARSASAQSISPWL